MNSRREFLGTSSIALAALAANSRGAVKLGENTPGETPRRQPDYWNDVPERMTAQVNAARAKRKSELAELKSRSAADERVAMVRTRVWELIGGKLDETPLNARTTGTIDRDAYRIEKIIFESQPEFYVTGNLYLPKSSVGRAPGIIAPLGHTAEGKTYRSYQTVFQNLARKGFVVFTWDPVGQGERLQYIQPGTHRSLYGPTGEHDRIGWPALLVGSTTTQLEGWDGIRALDYLLSRPEVDPQRIGCCGHSGGGTQTMYLCALEPRIKAAVVVEGHTENLAGANYEPPGAYADAEQNIIGGLKIPIDRGDLLAAFAPKPLLILYTPVDNGTTYSAKYVRGTEEIVDELRSLYSLYGAKDKVGLNSSPLPHDYDYFQRRSTYGWFTKWLQDGRGDVEEIPFDDGPDSALWCTSTGQVLTSIGGRTAYQVSYDRLQSIRRQAKQAGTSRDQIESALRKILDIPSSSSPPRTNSLPPKTCNDVVIEDIEFESEPGIRVPGWFLKPSTATSSFSVILMAEDRGKDGLFEDWVLIQQVTRAGFALCSIDLRTSGATRPRFPSEGPLFYDHGVEIAYSLVNLSIGSPIIGQQTYDLLRGLDYLERRKDVEGSRIGILGTGTSGLPCIAGAVLDSRVRSMMLNRTLLTLESVVASKDYDLPLSAFSFGILREFDLPDLCGVAAARAVWLLNPVGPQGEALALSDAQQAYRRADNSGKLSFRVQPDHIDDVVVEWARKTLA
jgi:cephalosporin-C deacetylase-like acetyl esterase